MPIEEHHRSARRVCSRKTGGARRNRRVASKAQAPKNSVSSPLKKSVAVDTKQPATHAPNRTQMSNNTLTDFRFTGNPGTNSAKLKTLAHGGPLVVAHDHWLPAMMPNAFADAAGGGKVVYMADFEAMGLDAMLLDAKGIAFSYLPCFPKCSPKCSLRLSAKR